MQNSFGNVSWPSQEQMMANYQQMFAAQQPNLASLTPAQLQQYQSWQQQYQLWQQQYGQKYEESVKAAMGLAGQTPPEGIGSPKPAPPLPPSSKPAPPLPPENVNPPLPVAPVPKPPENNPRPPSPKSESSEELSEAEKNFDIQFKQWEQQFDDWKKQNASHPDKTQYIEYEKKWETWRAQLLDRREQMRKKRLATSKPQPPKTEPEKVTPAVSEPKPTPLHSTPYNNEPLSFKPKPSHFHSANEPIKASAAVVQEVKTPEKQPNQPFEPIEESTPVDDSQHNKSLGNESSASIGESIGDPKKKKKRSRGRKKNNSEVDRDETSRGPPETNNFNAGSGPNMGPSFGNGNFGFGMGGPMFNDMTPGNFNNFGNMPGNFSNRGNIGPGNFNENMNFNNRGNLGPGNFNNFGNMPGNFNDRGNMGPGNFNENMNFNNCGNLGPGNFNNFGNMPGNFNNRGNFNDNMNFNNRGNFGPGNFNAGGNNPGNFNNRGNFNDNMNFNNRGNFGPGNFNAGGNMQGNFNDFDNMGPGNFCDGPRDFDGPNRKRGPDDDFDEFSNNSRNVFNDRGGGNVGPKGLLDEPMGTGNFNDRGNMGHGNFNDNRNFNDRRSMESGHFNDGDSRGFDNESRDSQSRRDVLSRFRRGPPGAENFDHRGDRNFRGGPRGPNDFDGLKGYADDIDERSGRSGPGRPFTDFDGPSRNRDGDVMVGPNGPRRFDGGFPGQNFIPRGPGNNQDMYQDHEFPNRNLPFNENSRNSQGLWNSDEPSPGCGGDFDDRMGRGPAWRGPGSGPRDGFPDRRPTGPSGPGFPGSGQIDEFPDRRPTGPSGPGFPGQKLFGGIPGISDGPSQGQNFENDKARDNSGSKIPPNQLSGFVGDLLAKLGIPTAPVSENAPPAMEPPHEKVEEKVLVQPVERNPEPEWKPEVFDYSDRLKKSPVSLEFQVRDYQHGGSRNQDDVKKEVFDYGNKNILEKFDYSHGGEKKKFDYSHVKKEVFDYGNKSIIDYGHSDASSKDRLFPIPDKLDDRTGDDRFKSRARDDTERSFDRFGRDRDYESRDWDRFGRDRESESRDRDRFGRDRESESRDRDRFGRDRESESRDRDRFGRDRESESRDRDRFGRDRESESRDRDRFGRDRDNESRDRDRFGRDRENESRDRDRFGRDRDNGSKERGDRDFDIKSEGRDRNSDNRDRDWEGRQSEFDREKDRELANRDRGSRDRREGNRSRYDADNDRERNRSPLRPRKSPSPRRNWLDNMDLEIETPKTETSPSYTTVLVQDLIQRPGRLSRPLKMVFIMRGIAGSGKSYVTRLIKEKEMEMGASAPRILSLDDYFMVDSEEMVVDEDTGSKVMKKVMKYEFDGDMEEMYEIALLKAFKKTVNDGFFQFIIVDAVNKNLKHVEDMWSTAKSKGFQAYVCEMDNDVTMCHKRNIHNRSEKDVEEQAKDWEPAPAHYLRLDVRSMLQSEAIQEVEMEDVVDEEDDSQTGLDKAQEENEEEKTEEEQAKAEAISHFLKSKWDNDESCGQKLDRLDGLKKKRPGETTMADYLQTDDFLPTKRPSIPGKKRVRWADVEEHEQQQKMRAIGFVVGQTDWKRMMDPSFGESALTRTKYF